MRTGKICACLISFVCLFVLISNASALTYNQYSGPANGSWSTATNWALGHVPTTAEKAGFKTAGGPLVTTSTAACGEWTLGGTSGGIITINSGGSVSTVTSGGGTGRISLGQAAGESGTLVMNGGTATFAGIIDLGYAGTGTIDLNGGTINAADFAMRASGGVGTMDITGGTLIITGDKTSVINGYVSSGWITGYGGSGIVNVNYNTPNAGKTTVTATAGGGAPGIATNPNPANGATGVATSPTLTWTADSGATSHDVYFGTDSTPDSTEFIGNQASSSYSPGTLANSTTYYWRIDEKNTSGTTTGNVWSFTTTAGSSPTVYPYLSIRGDPTNSIVVNWFNLDAARDSYVDYGPTSSYGSTVHLTTSVNYHHVQLTSLNSGATYHYRVRSSDGTVSGDSTFKTAAANATSFSFAVYGDSRGAATANEPYYSRHQALCNWLAPQNLAFILTTGDIVWEGSNSSSLSTFWTDYFRLESNLSKVSPIMTTLGNHEIQPTDIGTPEERYTNYKNFYMDGLPTNGTSGNEGRVYSFDYGNAHIVCLDSWQTSFTTQATWLDADLAAASADPAIQWIFVFMHYPLYTTSSTHPPDTEAQAAWGPIFDQYHVDIVFAGHNHVYERSKSIKNGAAVADGVGTVYVTNGLGGANFDPISSHPLFVTEYASQTVGTVVTINGNQLTVNSISNADAVTRDTFTLNYGSKPGKAANLAPANGATGVSTTNDLSWYAGSGATSHDVYFGTSSPGTFRGNQGGTTYDTGTMSATTLYYWRIDEKNAAGTTTGDVWSFTTATTPPPGSLPWTDGFESGNFTAGGWATSGSTSVATAAKHAGTYGAKVAGVAWIEKAVSTAGYNTIHVKYWRITAGYETTEALKTEWWNGSAWTEIDSSRSNAWTSKDITCAAGANNNPNFKVRFRSTGNDAATEYGYVDDVQVTGTAQ